MEDSLHDPLWSLRLLSHAFWIEECASNVLELYEQDLDREARRFCDSIPR